MTTTTAIKMTKHGRERIKERNISYDKIARALAGIEFVYENGNEKRYLDRKTRTYLVISEDALVTAMQLRPKQVRRLIMSRRKNKLDLTEMLHKEFKQNEYKKNYGGKKSKRS